jgi:hypothetical protein
LADPDLAALGLRPSKAVTSSSRRGEPAFERREHQLEQVAAPKEVFAHDEGGHPEDAALEGPAVLPLSAALPSSLPV